MKWAKWHLSRVTLFDVVSVPSAPAWRGSSAHALESVCTFSIGRCRRYRWYFNNLAVFASNSQRHRYLVENKRLSAFFGLGCCPVPRAVPWLGTDAGTAFATGTGVAPTNRKRCFIPPPSTRRTHRAGARRLILAARLQPWWLSGRFRSAVST